MNNYHHKNHQIAFALILSLLCVGISISAIADEPAVEESSARSNRNSRFVEDRNPSAAAFDKRLPPVIPGEEISDGKDRMNVWSTSGNLNAQEPPVPPKPNEFNSNRQAIPPIGVIVDQREGFAHGHPVDRKGR